jgi:hypothetical protein
MRCYLLTSCAAHVVHMSLPFPWSSLVAVPACLAQGYIGVEVPPVGTNETLSIVPECRDLTVTDAEAGCIDNNGGPNTFPYAVVPLFIQPADRERNITVTTCPQATDAATGLMQTSILAYAVTDTTTCGLTFGACSKFSAHGLQTLPSRSRICGFSLYARCMHGHVWKQVLIRNQG